MLAIGSMWLVFSTWTVLRDQSIITPGQWWRNRSMWLAIGLTTHGIGGVVLFALPWIAGYGVGSEGPALVVLWTVFGLWLVAKTIIVYVNGYLRVCLTSYAAWAVFAALMRLMA